jgi:hypothetical protein
MNLANRIGCAGAVIVCVSSSFPACSPANQNEGANGPSTFGQRYRFADNEIAGWKQMTGANAYSVWTPTNLTDKIDGGAPVYIERGFRTATYQDLVGPGSSLCTVVAMDFGTEAQATSMVTFEKQSSQADVSIPQYDPAVAIASAGITGITVFAHFKSAYLELHLDGYPDQTSAANAAREFLDILKRKAQ